MALNIWDLDDAPKPSTNKPFVNDTVGQIKGGYQTNGRPVASKTIVFTSDDPTVTSALAEAFGGETEELVVEKGDPFRLISESSSVDLVIDAPTALRSRFVLYGQSGLVYATDGSTITEGEHFSGAKVGDPFPKPESLAAWKAGASSGRQPGPEITLRGTISGLEDLGKLRYRTGGWSLVRDLPAIEEQLASAFEASEGQPVRVTLELREVTMKDDRTFVRPYLTVRG